MGKWKAVDVPPRQSGTKKFKKHTKNSVSPVNSKGFNSLDQIDLLFKEVDELLKSNSHPSTKKSETLGAGKIPEIFVRKKKIRTTYSPVLTSPSEASLAPRGEIVHTTVATPCSTADVPFSNSDFPSMGTMAIPPPLSPEIVVIPNIPCTNRFGPLEEEGDLPACVAHVLHGDAIENVSQQNNALFFDGAQNLHENVNLALVLRKGGRTKDFGCISIGVDEREFGPKMWL
ncbi:hypothetical protein NDU88_005655 [Pleurodeles waltl]|uniref:Uncharacterized protein n=1 Tax=Pleurodeles waltl TaxID=8319 RepID=A0AAV7SMJ0_PLEWA|nr:hypothetical protein NDU88_005655 [Pleurodeles waltl]